MRTYRGALAVCLLAALLSFPATPAGSRALPSDDPSVNQQRLAFADWTGKRLGPDRWRMFGALVWESDPAAEDPFRFGGVFKGVCVRRVREDGSKSIGCFGRGQGLTKNDEFTMDPIAGSARLDVRTKTARHYVEWFADNDLPGLYQSTSKCPAGEGHGAGIVRTATAGGHVYGHDRYSKWSFRHWNMLWTGAEVTECQFLSEREIEDLKDGGSFYLTFRS